MGGTREGPQPEPGCQEDSKGNRGAGEGVAVMSPVLPAPAGTSGLFAWGGSQTQASDVGTSTKADGTTELKEGTERRQKEIQTRTQACLTPHPETPRQARVHPSPKGQHVTPHRAKSSYSVGKGQLACQALCHQALSHTGVAPEGQHLIPLPAVLVGIAGGLPSSRSSTSGTPTEHRQDGPSQVTATQAPDPLRARARHGWQRAGLGSAQEQGQSGGSEWRQ